jgi:geranylgeranyl diphosphate synthase, type II
LLTFVRHIIVTSNITFMQTLSQTLSSFSEYVENQTFDHTPKELYEPIRYILSLGGKRIRPLLVLLSYQLFEDEIENAFPTAFAVEVFHNFTLMHDDIMDAAPLRRGKPTVHTKYNVNTGILSGDAMLILAYDYLVSGSGDAKTVTKLIKVFNKVAKEVCEGQQFDINFEKDNQVTIPAYLEMIRLKTAVLLAAALAMGAIQANADEKDIENLYDFGINIGLSFQIQDDILDTFGDAATFGKKVGGDIIQNKKTYLYLKSLQDLDKKDATLLFDFYNKDFKDEEEKIVAVKNLFDKANIKQKATQLQEAYYQTAMQHLAAVSASDDRKKNLTAIVNELMSRSV